MDFALWLQAIFHQDAHFEISLSGAQGRLSLGENWRINGLVLQQHLLYYVVEGALEAQVNGQFCRISAGDLVWFKAHSSIWTRTPPHTRALIYRFRLEARDQTGRDLPITHPTWHVAHAGNAKIWMERIVDEGAFPGSHPEQRLRALFACLLSELERAQNTSQSGVLTRTQRATLAQFLAQNATRWPSPREIADEVGLSPDYFSRCFKATFGVSPRRFLVEERLRLAAVRLLESNQNVSQVARELGYGDVFLFSRQFKAFWGQSPLAYRQSHSERDCQSES